MKKKVTRKAVPVTTPAPACGTCHYHKLLLGDLTMGNCHRYPQSSKSYTDHWCGEHKERT